MRTLDRFIMSFVYLSMTAAAFVGRNTTTPATFVPKVTELPQPQDLDDYDEDVVNGESNNAAESSFDIIGGGIGGGSVGEDLDLNDLLAAASERRQNNNNNNNSSKSAGSTSTESTLSINNNASRAVLSPIFDFVEFVLRPTSANENVVEAKKPATLHLDDYHDINTYDDDDDVNGEEFIDLDDDNSRFK